MKTSLKLKEERASLISELEALVETAKSESRDFTEAEETRQGEISEAVYKLDEQITRSEKSEEILLRNLASEASASETREMEKSAGEYSLQKAINEFRQGGRLSGLEAEMQQEANREFREAGISPSGHIQIPIGLTYRANTLSTNVAGVSQQGILQGLVPDSVIETAGGNRITGVAGSVKLPSLPSDATLEKTEVAEHTGASAMSSVTIDPVRFASRIDVSNQALALSSASFDSVVAAQFRRHSGGLMDAKAWANFVTAASAPTLRSTTAATTVPAIDFASANDLIAALGNAEALNASATFFGNHAQLATARSQQAVTNGGIPTLQADGTIAGYKAYGHSKIDATLIADTARTTDDVFVGGNSSDAITNETSLQPFFLVNMNDVYCCYWGGADLVIDNMTLAHFGVTRMIMNYYANCNVGHGGSVKYVEVA